MAGHRWTSERVACRPSGWFPDNSITRQWTQLVEELLPLEISQLFFFDAEKIRALAEDASSSETLGAAIKTLLGLDIVERLVADTTVLQARLAKQAGSPEERAGLEELERSQTNFREEISRLQTQRASLENERLLAESDLHDAEEAFSLSGGKRVEERKTSAASTDCLFESFRGLDPEMLDDPLPDLVGRRASGRALRSPASRASTSARSGSAMGP